MKPARSHTSPRGGGLVAVVLAAAALAPACTTPQPQPLSPQPQPLGAPPEHAAPAPASSLAASPAPASPDASLALEVHVPQGPSALQTSLSQMAPVRPLPPSDAQKGLAAKMDLYFQRAATRRLYLHLDKPLYQPGEAMWFRLWELASPTLTRDMNYHGVTVELVSPKGATVLQKRIQVQGGIATNDFELPASVQGGEYTLRATSDMGGSMERKVIVSSYQPPRVKKKVEFLRKAYGPADKVAATLSLHRATGEPLAKHAATAIATLDDVEVARFPLTTDGSGNSVVSFELPASIARGDGLLTVLVDDGGVTESIQKRIPIVLNKVAFDMFPEGGELVAELPGRVYFSAKNLIGKPADIAGRVVSSSGEEVAVFRSLHNGMGRFELTPKAGTSYHVEIVQPAGISDRFPVAPAKEKGCTMASLDDFDGTRDDVRIAVWCSESQSLIATAVLRERRLGDVAVAVKAGEPTVLAIPVPVGAQGAVRVTLLNEGLAPLAERLVYRGRGSDLRIAVKPDRPTYAPRDQVELTVTTTDPVGRPVAADLSMAVVDDTVLSFADDKTAHLLARLYLESEMPGQEIEEPNFYFSQDPKAPEAIDLVLGTQGWRRFDWQLVFQPPPPPPSPRQYDFADDMVAGALEAPKGEPRRARPAKQKVPRAAVPVAEAEPVPQAAPAAPAPPPANRRERRQAQGPALRDARRPPADVARGRLDRGPAAGARAAGRAVAADLDWGGEAEEQAQAWAWAPVRQFPAPTYAGRYDGPRVDFRETIYWAPAVQTAANGEAKVRFYLSDSVTSFRAIAEGVSAGGLPGRGEGLIQSKLPVSLAVTMPLEVSAGDEVKLPVTLTNETTRSYDVALRATFGSAFRLKSDIPGRMSLKGGERRSFFATLEVVGNGTNVEDGKAVIVAEASNLRDEVAQTIRVVPLGFPQEISLAGTLESKATARHELELSGILPGTMEASVSLYPSPLATMVKGTEAIIREPTGCFEQASSANYPNIMVLSYLEQNGAAEPELVERTMQMLDRGYGMLTGYESPTKGYEWFGGDPGHEALTAYGLMEFADMTKVYGEVDRTMIRRTQAWLKSRRNGKGGYQRNSRALDSFGQAGEEVTNGYITYALSETGETALDAELAYQRRIAETSKDPYVLALAVNTLLNIEPRAAHTSSALSRLAAMQADNGSFPGADHSITRSGGISLTIETTALAVLALIKAERGGTPAVRKAIAWLNENRSGYGSFGATQSTILSLKAMTAYAHASRATQSGGTVSLWVNGTKIRSLAFEKGHRDALVLGNIAASLINGKNTIELKLDGNISLPYSIAVSYRSRTPASSETSPVRVGTELAKAMVPMGEGVRMNVSVENVTDQGIPMTLARVGLPGGLTFQTWQLKELKDKRIIDFYETREREVVLYFRSMAPKARVQVPLELIARVPGNYVAPASRAYLYYTDEHKHWAQPVQVTVK